MTRQKSFKSQVRARMGKTGERYTAARHQLLGKGEPAAASPVEVTPEPPVEAIKPLPFSDDAVRERTGRGWQEWFALLDAWGGTGRTHTEIARWLMAEQGVDGWWAQSVAVGYEQARGMRAPGQRSDGSFYATGSRTVAVEVQRLFEAFADPGTREQWLPGSTLTAPATTPPKSFRARWEDGTRIVVGFTAKGDGRAQVAVAHEKLPDAETAARMKAYWRDRLAALKHLLEA